MLRLRQDIPLFPGGKKKAFTLSSDDGVTQDERLIALMKKYGIRGTFNLNSGLMGDRDWLVQPGINVSHYKFPKEDIPRIYGDMEIAVHTLTHPDLARIPSPTVTSEISEDKKNLEELARRPVRGMAYPFGTYNRQVLQSAQHCGILYGRTVQDTCRFDMPESFLTWHPTCRYCDHKRFALGREFSKPIADREYRSPVLFYVWGHSYELDAYGDWADLEEFFKEIGMHPEIWYATNMEICSYMEAVSRLVYSSSGDYIYNPSAQDVWLLIDRQTYQIPGGETAVISWKHHDDSTDSPD